MQLVSPKEYRYMRIAVAGALLFSYILTPVSGVFAQEAESTPPASDSASTESAPETSPASEQQTMPESEEREGVIPEPDTPSAEEAMPQEEEQAISEKQPAEEIPEEESLLAVGLETVGGGDANLSQSASPQVSTFDGSFTHSYPLSIPPGRSGLQPDLALIYSSSKGSDSDIFGYGWDISIPYIKRINKIGSENLYATSSTFYSSLSGELVQIGSTTGYRAKVEDGDFLQYTFANNAWTVTDKKGTVYRLGSTTSSRQDNASSTSQVYKWVADEIRDTNDNYIKFTYYKDAGQIYPATITYTGYGSTPGIFSIEFNRESRNDQVIKYDAGFPVISKYRIKEILAKVNGALVKKYALTYSTGDTNIRSDLSGIVESGNNGTATTTLPAMGFSYQSTHTDGWSENTSWTIPEPFTQQGKDVGTRLVDVNGDGLADIIRYYSGMSSSTQKLYFNNGDDGWDENTTWNWSGLNLPFTAYSSQGDDNPRNDWGTRFADVNGDGLTDVLVGHDSNTASLDTQKVYINTGSGWQYDSGWTLPLYFTRYYSSRIWDNGVRIGDINGDRLPDLVQAYWNTGDQLVSNVYINTGSGWTLSTAWSAPEPFTRCYTCSGRGADLGTQLIDVNNDGLDDIVRGYYKSTYGGTNKVYLNTGTGWQYASSWQLPDYFIYHDNTVPDNGYRFGEVNGDGLIDIVRNTAANSSARATFINTGTGWTPNITANPPSGVPFVSVTTGMLGDYGTRLLDIDGDGIADLIHSWTDSSHLYTTPVYRDTYISNRKVGDALASLILPTGGIMSVTYTGSAEYASGSTLLNPNLPYVLNTVSQVSYDSQFGDAWTENYTYTDGEVYFDPSRFRDRMFAGFGSITHETPRNKQIILYHQGNDTNSSLGEYSDDPSKIGFAYRTEIRNLNNNLYQAQISKWEHSSLGNNANFVRNTQSLELAYDGDSDHTDQAQTYAFSTTTGNMSEKVEWGAVTGSANGTFTDTDSDKFTTSLSYAASSTGHILELPSQQIVTDQSGTKVKESRYYYDTQSLGSLTKGNLTKQEDWVTGSTYIDTEQTYNAYGLVVTAKDPRDKTTTYTYDSLNLYPATISNPLSQEVDYAYDYSSGKVLTKTDENNRVFETVYDGLDRVTEEKVPDIASPSSLVTKTLYEYTDNTSPVKVKTTNYLDAVTSVDAYKYLDGFSRLIQERTEAETSNQFAVTDFVYDDGMLEKTSQPYFDTGSSRTSPTSVSDLYTTYTYDALARPLTSSDTRGVTTNAYDQWKTTTTDKRGKTKEIVRDGYDNLAQVIEHDGGNTYTTNYAYTYGHILTKITDALGNIRNIAYDGLGRRRSLEDLHDTEDVTFGTWQFSYDSAGNIASTTDPKGQITQYTYDDINRMLSENYTGLGGIEGVYGYDSCPEGVGRLCAATSTGAVTNYEYNAHGKVKKETKTIGSTPYTTNYSYDRQSNSVSIVYPDVSEVRYVYNTAGQLETIDQKESGGAWNAVITDFDYNSAEKPTVEAHANGATTTKSYDNFYRLSSIVTQSPSTNNKIQDISYTYDGENNITQITDHSHTGAGKVVVFGYDDLSRLTSASTTAASSTPFRQTYTYDAIGNITNKSDVGSYTYAETGYANPHAVTNIGSTGYVYDNNGNMTDDGSAIDMTWDYLNRLTQWTNGITTTTYGYDHTGERVKKTVGAISTIYPNQYYDTDASTTNRYIYAGDSLLATVKKVGSIATTYHTHLDHLGGTNVTTNASGTVEQVLDYYPFGSERIDSGGTNFDQKHKYTGHELDRETDLTYAGARYYDQNIGKWISQDTASRDKPEQFLQDPQQLNGYSYARNNPLVLVDPDGKKVELASRPINIPVVGHLGAHAFILITPDNPDALPHINGVDDYSRITLGGYTHDFVKGELFKGANYVTDYPLSRDQYSGVQTISPPNDMTQEEFEANIVNNFNNSPDVVGPYSFLGNPRISGQHNSNNFATNLLVQSGINTQNITNLKDNAYTAGLGRTIDPNAISALNRSLNSLSSALNSLKEKLKSKSSNNK